MQQKWLVCETVNSYSFTNVKVQSVESVVRKCGQVFTFVMKHSSDLVSIQLETKEATVHPSVYQPVVFSPESNQRKTCLIFWFTYFWNMKIQVWKMRKTFFSPVSPNQTPFKKTKCFISLLWFHFIKVSSTCRWIETVCQKSLFDKN